MPPRKLPPNNQLKELYESGFSSGQMAKIYNVTPSTVVSALTRCGVIMRTSAETNRILFKKGIRKSPSFWKGKKQPVEMVEKRASKIRGKNHWLWRGGKSKRDYRKVVVREKCNVCGSKINLGIHHKDLDHYNNAPDNLQVLCVSCHSSLHKQAYWDSIHSGKKPQKSNGPVGWKVLNKKKKL